METMNRRVEARVTGLVQGVSMRHYVRREAQRLGLTGWVANRPDGSVKVIAEGAEPALNLFVAFLHSGSPYASVDHVEADWLEATNEFSSFSVRF